MRAAIHRLFYDASQELRNGWWLAIWYVLFSVLRTLAFLLLGPMARGEIGFRLAQSLALAGSALLCLKLQKRPMRDVGLWPDLRWLREAGLGLVAGLLLMGLTALTLRALGGFHWEGDGPGTWSALPGVVGLCLAVALVEELLYRGYLFQRLVDGLGPWPTQLLMAGYFAFEHWGNPGLLDPTVKAWATLNIGLAAILLGLCYLRTRSLALPIGLHFGWNWAQGWLLGFPVSGTLDLSGPLRPVLHAKPTWLTGGAFGLEGSVLCAGVALGGILLLSRWKGVSADPSTGAAPADRP
ncbi:MAG TPA: CPBP family intramembrane glutamic endopeptidase [Holophagaceae bacterium]|nr:CPBP family intramembrane glutamic endopeptidase [Holophagaceae bacterium]